MKGKFSILLLALGTVAVVLVLVYNNNLTQPKPAKADRTVMVRRGEVVARLSETGSLEPVGVVEIKSEQSGEVKRLFVKEGDRVRSGQPLAIIQQESGLARQAAQLRASFEEERLNMEHAQRELDRQQALYAKGFTSLKEVEQAEKDHEKYKVKHDLARRQLLLLLGGNPKTLEEYLQKDLSSTMLDEFTIASPAPGTVIQLGVLEGEKIASGTSTVGGGTTLMKIADLSRMLVKSKINEVNITSVKAGQPVEIRLDAVPNRVYQGRVIAIAPQGERDNNIVTYDVTMEVKDADKALKPSMTANVDIQTGVYSDALYLPIEALAFEDGQNVVYVEKDGAGESRPVRVLVKTESVVVIEEGVQENERVILPNLEKG